MRREQYARVIDIGPRWDTGTAIPYLAVLVGGGICEQVGDHGCQFPALVKQLVRGRGSI